VTVANFNVRVQDDVAARFDGWAGLHGGRSPALRHLIETACEGAKQAPRLGRRPAKFTVRLTVDDAAGLATAAAEMGLTPNAWAAAVLRHRLRGRPTFGRGEELALIATQAELRRIGVNVNQIARALNTAVMEGKVLDLEMAYLEDLCEELRGHIAGLGEAFAGNLAYWQGLGD
jgi:hypothetical protein